MAEKWPCPACTFLNEATYANCDVCQEPRQKAPRRPPPPKRPAPPAPAPRTEKRRRRVVETPSDESDGEVLAGRLICSPASSGMTAICNSGLILNRRAPSMA